MVLGGFGMSRTTVDQTAAVRISNNMVCSRVGTEGGPGVPVRYLLSCFVAVDDDDDSDDFHDDRDDHGYGPCNDSTVRMIHQR